MATSRKVPGTPPDFDGDLDGGAPAQPGSLEDYFGSGSFEDDDLDVQHGSIAIDTGDSEPPPTESPVARPPTGAARAAAAPAASAASARKGWPTGSTPDAASIQIDRVEIDVTAGYGKSPSSVAMAPIYAARVYQRRRQLRAIVRELAARLTAAEYERDSLVVAMVRDLRGKILLTERGETLFEPVVALERTALERRAALAGKSAEYDDQSRELERHRVDVELEVSRQRAVLEQRAASSMDYRRQHDRAEAKRKRLYIEVRTIVEATAKAGASTAQANRIAELEAEIATQKVEVEALAGALARAESDRMTADNELRRLEKRLRDVDRRRKDLDQSFQKEIGTRTEGVSEADKQRFDALRTVGLAVLAARGRVVDVASDVLDNMSRAESVVLGCATDLEKAVRAVDSYNVDAYRRGIFVAAAVAAATLVALVMLASR